MIKNKKFKNAIDCKEQKVPPIWFMRQAGRYHNHYQNLRKSYTFEDLCKNPELAMLTAMGPIEEFDFDVAILFSDILFPLESLGLDLQYIPGPTFNEKIQPKHIKDLKSAKEIANDLQFQSEALKLTRKELPEDKSLVGFVGGPWTLLSFAAGIKNELQISDVEKNKFFEEALYDVLIPIIKESIKSQLNSGAEIVYIFDTNAVQLEKRYFNEKYIGRLKNELFLPFNKRVAYFTKNDSINHFDDINNEFSLAGYVYNSLNGLPKKLKKTKKGFVQGNFSPESLLKKHSDFLNDYNLFKNKMLSISSEHRAGWICSLNHGILPKTPEENVKYFINDIRNSFGKL
tara:strand:+ start:5473 stop:6504 length:1032 start_codon:yes stop_codon:yes gene_type:complete